MARAPSEASVISGSRRDFAPAVHQARWSSVRLPSDTPRRPEVSIDMSTAGAPLRTASLPAPGAGGGAAGRLRGPLGGLELSLRMLPSLPGGRSLPHSSRPPTGWRMPRVLPCRPGVGPGVGGIGGSSSPSRPGIAVWLPVSSSSARTTRCPRRNSQPSSSAISEGDPASTRGGSSPEGPASPLGSPLGWAGGASTAATAALRSSEWSCSAPSAPEARRERSERRVRRQSNRDRARTNTHCGDRCAPAAPSLLKSRLGWPRCLTCVCASASCIARAHAHRVQRKRLRRAGQRRQMLTCCCREARARWLQMRHSSRLYALLPGSTPSLRPCHAPPKLRGLRGLGGCGRAGSPQLLREGRRRLQARLTDREALVDRHARSFRRVLLRLLVRARRVETVVVVADRLAGREALPDEQGGFRLAGTQNPQMFLLVPRVLKRTPRRQRQTTHSANRTRERDRTTKQNA